MKKIVLLIFVCISFSYSYAQTKQTPQKWLVIPSISLLNGKEKVSTSIQLESGIRLHHSWLSLQAGIDYYKMRTIPLSLQYKQILTHGKQQFFLQAGGGVNFPWLLEEQKLTYYDWGINTWNYQTATYSKGYTYQFGAGFLLTNKQGKGIITSIGFHKKTLQEQYTENLFNGTTTVKSPVNNTYYLNRLVLQVGYCF